jgi:hypothetical protein
MKQTAVEWLYKKLHKENYIYEDMTEFLKEAKEMEKKQIIDAIKEGTKYININDEISAEFNGIIYYNETFKNK